MSLGEQFKKGAVIRIITILHSLPFHILFLCLKHTFLERTAIFTSQEHSAEQVSQAKRGKVMHERRGAIIQPGFLDDHP